MAQSKITVATWITISRFFLVPVFILLFLREYYLEAASVLVFTGLTDFADGYVARHFKQRSRLGSFLDPAADKFLMLCSFLVLSVQNYMPWKLTLLVIGRDVFISAGVAVLNLLKVKLLYKPTLFSKLTTTSQIIVLALYFLDVFFENELSQLPQSVIHALPQAKSLFFYLAGALTITTFFQYGYIGYKFYRYGERKN